jgi:hypothetical protein
MAVMFDRKNGRLVVVAERQHKRVPQEFRVIVQEKTDFPFVMNGMEMDKPRNIEDAKLRALVMVGMTPHPKYFNRIKKYTHSIKSGQRVWKFTIVRP